MQPGKWQNEKKQKVIFAAELLSIVLPYSKSKLLKEIAVS